MSSAEDCLGETVLSVKQLLSRAGWYANSYSEAASDYFTPLPTWFSQITDTPYDTNLSMPAVNYTWYFTTAYAFARGGTRVACLPLTTPTLQEVRFVDSQTGYAYDLASTGNYISEHSALHFTIPFYSTKSRVRISTAQNTPVGIASRLPPYDTPTTRVHISAADDAQLGFFLGAPPMLASGLAYTSGPFTGWDPSRTAPTSVEITGQPIQTRSLMLVNDAAGNPTPVTTDTQDSFTVFHSGNMSWNGSSWTRVGGNGALSVTAPSPIPVAVAGTVPVTLPVNQAVIACGLDGANVARPFSARQATDDSYTLPITVYANTGPSSIPVPVNTYVGGDTVCSLYVKTNST